ncbi:hypothetical protein ABKS89_11160 [Pseudomonas sp. LABIM340]|uniref:hypothetical protein n=1 Tax=Pseudomonas sp. LABIM340 TaxID=3156585 RepID=UPI0032AEAF47
MFLTPLKAEIENFGLFGDAPCWRFVEHSIHRPWFYVATEEVDESDKDGFTRRPMLMLTDEDLLETLLAEQGEQIRVGMVLLVTPNHMNQSGRWLMEPLDTLDRYETARGLTFTYQVQGGSRYVWGDGSIIHKKGVKRRQVFSRSMLS